MSKKYYSTYPAEKIIVAYEKGRFEAFTVTGKGRVGKSTYAIKSARDVHMTLNGCDMDEGYRRALKSIEFEKKAVFGVIRKYMEADEVLPILIWDDTGVHGSGYQFFLNPIEVAALKGSMDTIGTGVSGLMMTTTTAGGILKFIRDYHFPEITITQQNSEWERIAQPREYYRARSAWKTRKTNTYDKFSGYLPNWVWDKYITRRKVLAIKAIDSVLKTIDKQTEGSTGEETKIKQMEEMTALKKRIGELEVEKRAEELATLPGCTLDDDYY